MLARTVSCEIFWQVSPGMVLFRSFLRLRPMRSWMWGKASTGQQLLHVSFTGANTSSFSDTISRQHVSTTVIVAAAFQLISYEAYIRRASIGLSLATLRKLAVLRHCRAVSLSSRRA